MCFESFHTPSFHCTDNSHPLIPDSCGHWCTVDYAPHAGNDHCLDVSAPSFSIVRVDGRSHGGCRSRFKHDRRSCALRTISPPSARSPVAASPAPLIPVGSHQRPSANGFLCLIPPILVRCCTGGFQPIPFIRPPQRRRSLIFTPFRDSVLSG